MIIVSLFSDFINTSVNKRRVVFRHKAIQNESCTLHDEET